MALDTGGMEAVLYTSFDSWDALHLSPGLSAVDISMYLCIFVQGL